MLIQQLSSKAFFLLDLQTTSNYVSCVNTPASLVACHSPHLLNFIGLLGCRLCEGTNESTRKGRREGGQMVKMAAFYVILVT